jgi:hypothetical protein
MSLRLIRKSHSKLTGHSQPFCRVSGSGREGAPRNPSPSLSPAGHFSPAGQLLSGGLPKLPTPHEFATFRRLSHVQSTSNKTLLKCHIPPTPGSLKKPLSLKVRPRATRKPSAHYVKRQNNQTAMGHSPFIDDLPSYKPPF